MESYEVRIHYAANNMVSEDARWMRVARGMTSFRPTRRFRLSDSIIDASELAAHGSGNQPQPFGPTQPMTISSGSDLVPMLHNPVNECSNIANEESARRTGKRKTIISFEEPSPAKERRTKRTSFARTRQGLNPDFKSPIFGYLKPGKVRQPLADTPRNRIASETTVLVPVTKSPRRPHDLPDVESSEREQFDSRSQSLPVCIDETLFTDHLSNFKDTSTAKLSAEVQVPAGDCSSDTRSYPCNQEQLLSRPRHVRQSPAREFNMSYYAFQTGFEENEISIGTQIAQSAHKTPRSTSTRTTATPSDRGDYAHVSSPLAQKSKRHHSPVNTVVDLTLSPDLNTLQMTRRDVLGPVSSPTIRQQQTSSHSDAAKRAGNKRNFSLPRKAMCKASCTVKSRHFESFVPHYLLELAEKFELLNQFRPVSAPTSMRNSDRGYWNLRIKVADLAAVTGARRPPLTSSQWSDQRFMMRQEGLLPASVSSEAANNALRDTVYPNKDPRLYTPWTACELETFWAYLSKVIERGQAGYDVHATLKRCGPASKNLDVDVKLYGYAESLSHLWLLLYGISGTLTASMPLQWHVPGAGPLITMSGQLKHGGELGRWVPRGTGISASWGLEDNWDGLSSAVDIVGSANP